MVVSWKMDWQCSKKDCLRTCIVGASKADCACDDCGTAIPARACPQYCPVHQPNTRCSLCDFCLHAGLREVRLVVPALGKAGARAPEGLKFVAVDDLRGLLQPVMARKPTQSIAREFG